MRIYPLALVNSGAYVKQEFQFILKLFSGVESVVHFERFHDGSKSR